jgi:O-antigen ligase
MMKQHVAKFLLVACVGVLATPLLAGPAVLLSIVAFVYLLREGPRTVYTYGSETCLAMNALLISFGFWFLSVMTDTIIHRDAFSEIDNALRFLLAIGAFWIVVATNTRQVRWVFYGIIAASVFSAVIAYYQHEILGVERAAGWTNNAIYFGNLCSLLTIYAVIILATYWQKLTLIMRNALIVSLMLSVFASVASMSRSSFLGLISLMVLVNINHQSGRRMLAGAIFGVIATLALLLTSPPLAEKFRVTETIQHIQKAQQGDYNTSLGIRMQMWKGSALLFISSPAIGVGSGHYREGMEKLAANGDIDPAGVYQPGQRVTTYNQPHSGILDALATKGILGLLAYLLIFVLPYRSLAKLAATQKPEAVVFCKMGQATIIAFFIFGISNSIFRIQIYSAVYPISVAVFTALALNFVRESDNAGGEME